MAVGWIKLYRQLQDCDIWIDDEPFDCRSAWIDLLLLANHEDKNIIFDGHRVTVQRGQYLTSVRKLAARWRWGKHKTLSYLKLLEECEMIVREADSRRTLVTIVNYEIYQAREDNEGTVTVQSGDSSGTVRGHSLATNKNIKNKRSKEVKNIKENNTKEKPVYYPNDEALDKAFADYVDMRKKIKKPLTDRAIELAMKKLDDLSGGDNDIAIKIIEQSVLNSWQGLFPLKEKGDKQSAGNRTDDGSEERRIEGLKRYLNSDEFRNGGEMPFV